MSELADELNRLADTEFARVTLIVRFNPPTGELDWKPMDAQTTLADKLREAAAALSRAEAEGARWKEHVRSARAYSGKYGEWARFVLPDPDYRPPTPAELERMKEAERPRGAKQERRLSSAVAEERKDG